MINEKIDLFGIETLLSDKGINVIYACTIQHDYCKIYYMENYFLIIENDLSSYEVHDRRVDRSFKQQGGFTVDGIIQTLYNMKLR